MSSISRSNIEYLYHRVVGMKSPLFNSTIVDTYDVDFRNRGRIFLCTEYFHFPEWKEMGDTDHPLLHVNVNKEWRAWLREHAIEHYLIPTENMTSGYGYGSKLIIDFHIQIPDTDDALMYRLRW